MAAAGNPKDNIREASQSWFYPLATKSCTICWIKPFLTLLFRKVVKENLWFTHPHVVHQKQWGLACVAHLAVEH